MINKSKNRGFTLLETLVAILIMTTAITGPLTVAYKGFSAATVAKDQITAFFLAQDALEYIRFARDTNRLKGADWINGTGGLSAGIDLSPCVSPNWCYLDSAGLVPTTPTACVGTPVACPTLKYDTAAGTYQYDATDQETMFTRTVSVVSIVSGAEIVASTTVTWAGQSGITRSVTLFENLLNWQ
ncbi:MAG: type II secretion system protein [Patescibacteria group bacterium]